MDSPAKIVSLFILLTFSAPLAYLLFLQLTQARLQYVAKERMEQQILQRITLKKEKVHWIKKEKEIKIGGRMFDIKSFKEHNGSYTFAGIYDDEETSLMEHLEESWDHEWGEKTKMVVQLFQLLQMIFCYNSTAEFSSNPNTSESYSSGIPSKLAETFIPILTPPPQGINYCQVNLL